MITIKKALRYFILFFGALLVVLIAFILSIRLPAVQNYVTAKAIDYVQSKTNSKIELERVYIGFFNSVILEGLYVEDLKQDTLAYVGSLEVSLDVFSLVGKKINISDVTLTNSTVKLNTSKESADYNFQFIIDAFSSDSSSTPVAEEDTSASSWTVGIDDINLSNIHFTYNDLYNGVSSKTSITEFAINVQEFDLVNNQLTIDKLLLANTNTSIRLMKSYAKEDTSSSSSTPFNLIVNSLSILNNQFDYTDEVGQMSLTTHVGDLKLVLNEFDLINQNIDIQSINIHKSAVQFSQGKSNDTIKEAEISNEGTTSNWNISLANLIIDTTQFKYDDNTSIRLEKGMDFSHLLLNFKELEINDFSYKGLNDIALKINNLSIDEQSGFNLQDTHLDFKMSDTTIKVSQLSLLTSNGTKLTDNFEISYTSLERISSEPEDLGLSIHLVNSAIYLKDATYFSPELASNPYFKHLQNQVLRFSADVDGTVNDLAIKQLNISILDKTNFHAHGSIKNTLNPELLFLNLSIDDLSTTNANLNRLLPKGELPEGITLPNKITINGKANGGLNVLSSQMAIITTLGNVNFDATIKNGGKNIDSIYYEIELKAKQLSIGTILNDTNFNEVTISTKLTGKGVNPSQLSAALAATISDFEYKNYSYAPFTLEALYEREFLSWSSAMRDTNLLFDLDGEVKLAEDSSTYKVDFNLIGADFQLLNLIKDDTRLKGTLTADLTGNSIDNIIGNLAIRKFQVLRNDEIYQVDSLLFFSFKDSINSNIELSSDIINGFFKGNVQLSTIGTSVQNFFKGYYDDSLKTELKDENQQFSFDLTIKDNPLLSEVLLIDLTEFEDSYINGEFNAKENFFTLDASFPRTVYSDIKIDSLRLNARANGKQLTYALDVEEINQGDLLMRSISLLGETNNDTLTTRFLQKELDKPINYLVEFISFKKEDNVRIEFRSDSTIINRNYWTITPKSFIEFGDQLTTNLEMKHDAERLTLKNDTTDKALLLLNFNEFKIQNLINFVKSAEADSIRIISGKLNGNTKVSLKKDDFGFVANLKLNNLQLFEEAIGNIQLDANNVQDYYEFLAVLSGNKNDISLTGTYTDSNSIDMYFDIKQLNMETIAAFSQGQLLNPTGSISGNFSVNGSTTDPDISGLLNFNKIKFRSSYLNSEYSLLDERISIDNETIQFKQFTVIDSIGNNFKINGDIQYEDLDNYAFDLTIKSKNFQALNTTKESNNDLFYGKVLFSSDLSIKGDEQKPIINAKLKLNKGTDFTFVLPESDPSQISQEGVIVFVDKDQNLSDIFSRKKGIDTVKADILGLDVTAQIEIDENTNFNIIVDPIAGDKLTLKGGGTLNSQIDQSGNVSLTGRYTINDGMYNLTLYDFVKRDFLIEKGSSITWTGDPLKAEMDISAIYEVKAAPIDLLSNQSGSLTESERLAYQEKLPFLVSLNMDNELMSPAISFDIDLEEDKKGALNGLVYAKLQELNQSESELNKQVFTLILLNRFISTGNFSNQSDGANVARNSVSKIMNQQLNRLSDKYVKGVNLELNLDSYEGYNTESGGFEGRTELNLAVSKSFLNDRVAVKVGGDVDLEGERAKQNTISDFAGDLSIEYSITEDGRYKAKLYRDNRFEGVLEGDIIETGVSLIYNRDYDSAEELFRKPKPIKEEKDDQ